MDLRMGLDKSRKNVVLISAAIIVVALFLARSIYRGQQARIENLKAKIAEEQAKNRILTEIGKRERGLESYQPLMPPERDVEWLRRRITELADESQVKLLSISPRAPEDRGIYVRLSVEVEVECGYHQLGDFLSRLESSKEFVKLDSIDFRREKAITVKAVEEEAVGKAKLVVSTFYLKEEVTAEEVTAETQDIE